MLDHPEAGSATAYDHYAEMLNETESGETVDAEPAGLGARARAHEPAASTSIPSGTGRSISTNFMHFLSLRADPHAQYEIRVYADAMVDVLRKWVPLTAEAFEQHRLHAMTLSKNALDRDPADAEGRNRDAGDQRSRQAGMVRAASRAERRALTSDVRSRCLLAVDAAPPRALPPMHGAGVRAVADAALRSPVLRLCGFAFARLTGPGGRPVHRSRGQGARG